MRYIRGHLNAVTNDGEPIYADVPEFLEAHFKGDTARLKATILALESQACAILGLSDPIRVPEPFVQVVPVVAHQQARRGGVKTAPAPIQGRLYQLGFTETASLKGASSLVAILNILKTNIEGSGNQTGKYPIEVLYQLVCP
jgi:hypothetical protein